jgi:hypothetical protein
MGSGATNGGSDTGTHLRTREDVRREHHAVHFYLALLGLLGSIVVFALSLWAYYDEGMTLTHVTFAAVLATTAVLFVT